MMMRKIPAALGAAMLMLAAGAASAQPMVYPAKGQSAGKQSSDDNECRGWARQSTGVDPAMLAAAPQPAPGPQGERARGAARGAVGGAAIGAIAGDAEEGAGVGAVVGTMSGGRQARQRQAAQGQQQQNQQQAMSTYYRAYSACMSGRGYSVQ
jgi:Glycine zipper